MELLTHKKQGSIDLLKDEEKIKSNSQKKVVFTICVVLLLASSLLSAAVFAYSLTQKIRLNNLKKEVDTKIVAWQALEPVSTSIKTISQKNLVISQTHRFITIEAINIVFPGIHAQNSLHRKKSATILQPKYCGNALVQLDANRDNAPA